jgi:hypothetical protein
MAYLIRTTEVYRADDENEAKAVIEEAKRTSTVIKYNSTYKCKKQKGEIVDEWYKVEITKEWDDEKEPSGSTVVKYSTGSAWSEDDED